MRKRLGQMSLLGNSTPSLGHYLKFLDCWRAGDYASAFDNLHRYFDYTMQSRDRTFYQYALLNLSILQADFGCHNEAIPAMQEAISTARENKDVTCLNFCMSWLYHFGKAFPAEMKDIRESGMLGSENEALVFLKTRAKDSEMWSLLSTTLLNEAKLGLQNVRDVGNRILFSSLIVVGREYRYCFRDDRQISTFECRQRSHRRARSDLDHEKRCVWTSGACSPGLVWRRDFSGMLCR